MSWGFRLACVAVLLLAVGLRLHQLGRDSFWYDEIVQASLAAEYSALELVQAHLPYATAPLDTLITNVILQLGRAEYLLRFPAACFAGLTVAVCFALARAMFGSLEGLIAAFLLTISASHIRYAQELRPYALLAFLGSLSLWFLWRALRHDCLTDWLAWSSIGIAGLLAHPVATFWALAHGAYGLTATGLHHWRGRAKFALHAAQLRKMLTGISLMLIGAGAQFALAITDYSQRIATRPTASRFLAPEWVTLTRRVLLQLGNGTVVAGLCLAAILSTYLIAARQGSERPAI